VRWQKMALLVLLKGRLVGGAKPNVPFVQWQLLTALLFSMVFVNTSYFKIFCAVGKKN
jgi:hypothetical protein